MISTEKSHYISNKTQTIDDVMCQAITEGSAWSDDGFNVIRCDDSLHLDLIAPLASCYLGMGMCVIFLILHPYSPSGCSALQPSRFPPPAGRLQHNPSESRS